MVLITNPAGRITAPPDKSQQLALLLAQQQQAALPQMATQYMPPPVTPVTDLGTIGLGTAGSAQAQSKQFTPPPDPTQDQAMKVASKPVPIATSTITPPPATVAPNSPALTPQPVAGLGMTPPPDGTGAKQHRAPPDQNPPPPPNGSIIAPPPGAPTSPVIVAPSDKTVSADGTTTITPPPGPVGTNQQTAGLGNSNVPVSVPSLQGKTANTGGILPPPIVDPAASTALNAPDPNADLQGDLNGDGKIDAADALLAKQIIAARAQNQVNQAKSTEDARAQAGRFGLAGSGALAGTETGINNQFTRGEQTSEATTLSNARTQAVNLAIQQQNAAQQKTANDEAQYSYETTQDTDQNGDGFVGDPASGHKVGVNGWGDSDPGNNTGPGSGTAPGQETADQQKADQAVKDKIGHDKPTGGTGTFGDPFGGVLGGDASVMAKLEKEGVKFTKAGQRGFGTIYEDQFGNYYQFNT